MTVPSASEEIEDVEEFRMRARAWMQENLDPIPNKNYAEEQLLSDGVRAREIQRRLFQSGFAGLCFPVEYGGQGLTRLHQRVFTEESVPYEMPVLFNNPTLTIIAPTLLEFCTEEQKRLHLTGILRGEELWVQLLSEPNGGSDLAGVLTRAASHDDGWLLNGSKIWTTGAHRADYGLCLARTDWDVPKHEGLTLFIVKVRQPGVEVQQIRMSDGTEEFCQEFFTDVILSPKDVIGQVNDGWTVTRRLLFHERDAVGGGSPYFSGEGGQGSWREPQNDLIDLARANGRENDLRVRQSVARVRAHDIVQKQLIDRVSQGLRSGYFPSTGGALLRLYDAANRSLHVDAGLEIAGATAAAWDGEEAGSEAGIRSIVRQRGSLGGGSSEMQRNIIAERILGMPREFAADRDRAFSEVRHNTIQTDA